MVRTTENITVSIPKDMSEQIDKLKLKPSKILQDALGDIIEKSKGVLQLEADIKSLKESMWRTHQVLADFLDEKKIDFSEYNQFVFAWNKRREDGSDKLV